LSALSAEARGVLAVLAEGGRALRAVDIARRLDVRIGVVRAALVSAIGAGLARRASVRGRYEVVA
jgi:DNA-binding IclR family transcriptional regulator